jgi:hypothetical protein
VSFRYVGDDARWAQRHHRGFPAAVGPPHGHNPRREPFLDWRVGRGVPPDRVSVCPRGDPTATVLQPTSVCARPAGTT